MKSRKLKYGGFSLLVTVIFLAGIILLNVLANIVTSRFFLKTDLTEMGLFTLSPEAEEALGYLRDDIEFIVLAEEIEWLSNILQQYGAASGGRIKVSFTDPDLNPRLKERFPELSGINRNDIIVSSDLRATSFPIMEMQTYTYNSNFEQVPAFNADQKLIGAIQYVLSEKVAIAAFIQGHEEEEGAALRYLLERFGYDCVNIDLAFEAIPEDTVLLVATKPKRDFTEAEIEKLDVYMGDGGNALIGYDYGVQSLPRLDQYLLEWGVAMENKLVLDSQNFYIPYPFFLRAQVNGPAGAPPSLDLFEQVGVYVGMPLSRPIQSVWASDTRGHRTVFPIISSYPGTSYAKDTGDEIQSMEREDGDIDGPFMLGAAIRQGQYDSQSRAFYSYMLVVNASFFDDTLLSDDTTYYNSMMMAALADDLNPYGEESVYIPGKPVTDFSLDVTPGQARTILILLVILLPLLIVAAGVLTWRRRKHL